MRYKGGNSLLWG